MANRTLEQLKITAAVQALVESGLNQSQAAKALDISRGALRTYLQAYTESTDNSTAQLNQRVLLRHLNERG